MSASALIQWRPSLTSIIGSVRLDANKRLPHEDYIYAVDLTIGSVEYGGRAEREVRGWYHRKRFTFPRSDYCTLTGYYEMSVSDFGKRNGIDPPILKMKCSSPYEWRCVDLDDRVVAKYHTMNPRTERERRWPEAQFRFLQSLPSLTGYDQIKTYEELADAGKVVPRHVWNALAAWSACWPLTEIRT